MTKTGERKNQIGGKKLLRTAEIYQYRSQKAIIACCLAVFQLALNAGLSSLAQGTILRRWKGRGSQGCSVKYRAPKAFALPRGNLLLGS